PKESAIFQTIIGSNRPFIWIHEQSCRGGNDEITVSCSLLKNTSIQRGDVGMGIKMVPSNIRKIDDISIGQGALMSFKRHSRLDVFPMIFEWMHFGFFVSRICLINTRDFCQRGG